MKNSPPPQDSQRCAPEQERPPPGDRPEGAGRLNQSASAVLRAPLAVTDRTGRLQAQQFVLRSLSPLNPKMIESAQIAARVQPPQDDPKSPVAQPWKDSSGEGAASALESLRKLEQRRLQDQPPQEERPASD
jgi:hypothetical protein